LKGGSQVRRAPPVVNNEVDFNRILKGRLELGVFAFSLLFALVDFNRILKDCGCVVVIILVIDSRLVSKIESSTPRLCI